MAVDLSPVGGAAAQFFDNNGDPLSGGLLYTYLAGTTTNQQTYTTSVGNVAHTNPIVLDAAGRVPAGGEIWLVSGVAYKFILKTSTNILIATWDDISGVSAAGNNAANIPYTPPFPNSVTTNIGDKLAEIISVSDFGAVGDGVTDDTAAIQAALDYLDGKGGFVYMPEQYYVCSNTLYVPDSVTLMGRGVGSWDTVFPNRPKTWTGTNILFKGTGPKTHAYAGITSGESTGGWRENPDAPGTYYKLSSLMTSTAAGSTPATPKAFSVGITGKTQPISRHWGVRDLRVVPWIGTDGTSKYSDPSYLSLANDWDCGILFKDSEYVTLYNVQSVGYWRMYGCALVNPDFTDYGGQERNNFQNCKFQGNCGLSVRSGDQWKVMAKTNSTVEIYWTDESYWPSSGMFTGLPASSYIQYRYTSLSRNGSNLVFNGVIPDPTVQNIDFIRPPYRSSGAAGTYFLNVVSSGLDHTSGQLAQTFGIQNSKALEVSGFPMRGVQFINYKAQTSEDIVAFLHNCEDTLFVNSQFEGSGRMIATPFATASTAPAPAGDTRKLRMLSTILTPSNLTLFTPRSIHDDERQYSPNGLSGEMQLKPLPGQSLQFFTESGKNLDVFRSTGLQSLRITDSGNVSIMNGGQLSFTGGGAVFNADAGERIRFRKNLVDIVEISVANNLLPGTDNTQSLGNSANRWSTVFAGTGTINTSDAREKQQIRSLTKAEHAVAVKAKNLLRAFKFNDAVDAKGDKARVHFGVVAQDLKQAFESEGLDPFAYGILCYDEWGDEFEPVYAIRNVETVIQTEDGPVTKTVEERYDTGERKQTKRAGNRYGVRYDQLYAFILGAI